MVLVSLRPVAGRGGRDSFLVRERHLRDERGVDAAPDRRLRRFLDMVPTQVLFMTPTFEVEFVNRQVQTYYGNTLEELQAWDFGPVHPDDVPMTFERLDRLTRLEEPFDGQTRMRRADGEYRWMHSRMVPTRTPTATSCGTVRSRTKCMC